MCITLCFLYLQIFFNRRSTFKLNNKIDSLPEYKWQYRMHWSHRAIHLFVYNNILLQTCAEPIRWLLLLFQISNGQYMQTKLSEIDANQHSTSVLQHIELSTATKGNERTPSQFVRRTHTNKNANFYSKRLVCVRMDSSVFALDNKQEKKNTYRLSHTQSEQAAEQHFCLFI